MLGAIAEMNRLHINLESVNPLDFIKDKKQPKGENGLATKSIGELTSSKIGDE